MVEDLRSLVKDKRSIWQRNLAKRTRNSRLVSRTESQRSSDENARAIIIRGLKRIRKIR